MKRVILVPMLALLVLVGCSEPEPEPPPPATTVEPPKRTADQLFQETMTKLEPTLRPAAPKALPMIAIVTDAKNTFRPPVEPNGEEAVSRIKRELNQRFDAATSAGQWNLVIAIAGALDIFAKGPPNGPAN